MRHGVKLKEGLRILNPFRNRKNSCKADRRYYPFT